MNAIAPTSLPAASPSALVDRAALSRAATIAALVIETRNTYPILANVRLRGDGKTLFMSGTNLDIAVDVVMPAAADADLDVTIPAHGLASLLKGAPKASDMVSIALPPMIRKTRKTGKMVTDPATGAAAIDAETNEPVPATEDYFEMEGNVSLDFGAVKYSVPPLSSDNWPKPFVVRKEWTDETGNRFKVKSYRAFTMSGADLFAALDAVQFAISNEETRYYLNGVFMHVPELSPYDIEQGAAPMMRFVTTDGHRMARQEIAAPEGSADMGGIILPKATVYLLLKLLKPAKGKPSPAVAIELTEKHVRLQFDDVTVTSKLVEGTFPDYERVTPKNNDRLATFNVPAMLEAIKAVSMIASERGGKAVKLELSGGKCTLSVNNPDNGTAESTIAADMNFEGPLEIGFNAKYLADLVTEAKADGETVTMAFNDHAGSTLVTGSRADWLGVLMPMRV